jgi:myosin heavy subunit
LAVAGINLVQVKSQIMRTRGERDSERSQKDAALTELANTKTDLEKTTKERDAARSEIASAQETRDKAVVEAENQTKRAAKAVEDLSKVQQEKTEAEQELAAWRATGKSVDQINSLVSELKQAYNERDALVETNKGYRNKIVSLNNRLMRYEDPDNYRVELPSGLHGRVLVADPKWEFVVLDVGEKQGALEDGVMIVNRNGRLVAKVQIRSVQTDRSIANVLPNWKLGEVMEGDEVIP